MKIAFIGLGIMGRPMALNLLKGGHDLTVWARRAESMEPLLASGAKGAGSPIFVSEWFLAFTAFVGLNLLQSGFTGFCPPEKLLAKLGFKRGNGSCGV